MLRDLVRWDYELRDGLQLETVIDRPLMIATSPPEGPVFEQVCVAAGSYRRADRGSGGFVGGLCAGLARRQCRKAPGLG